MCLQLEIAVATFYDMKKMLIDKRMYLKVSITMLYRANIVLQCCIEQVLLYGCESWTINKHMLKKLEATEIQFWRRLQKYPGQPEKKMKGHSIKISCICHEKTVW